MTRSAQSNVCLVRRCTPWDIPALADLLKVCWHSTYDAMLGPDRAAELGLKLYGTINLGLLVSLSGVFRNRTILVATQGVQLVGYAVAEADGADEIVLYALYVHPNMKGRGIGSTLLEASVAAHPDAKAIRLEVLKANTAAIAWYQAKGFVVYGETEHATGTRDVPALYMDKVLEVRDQPQA